MSKTDDILKKYQDQHSALGRQRDAVDREAFDTAHRQIWANCETELEDRRVELTAKPELVGTEREELARLNMDLIMEPGVIRPS